MSEIVWFKRTRKTSLLQNIITKHKIINYKMLKWNFGYIQYITDQWFNIQEYFDNKFEQ